MFYRNFLDWNFRKKKNKFLQKFLGKFLLKKKKKEFEVEGYKLFIS